MGSKKMQVWLPVIFAIVMVVGMMIGYQLKDKASGNRFFNLSKRTSLQELIELVKDTTEWIAPPSSKVTLSNFCMNLIPETKHLQLPTGNCQPTTDN